MSSRPKDFHIKVSDNGGFIVRCEKEERLKDGMTSWKSKEYVYDSMEEMFAEIRRFLKPELKKSGYSKEIGLKSR